MKRKTIEKIRLLAVLLICMLAAAGCGHTSAKTDGETSAQDGSSAVSSESEKTDKNETTESASGSKETMKDLIGIYHLTGRVVDGVVTPTKEIAILEEMGMEMLLILNEDGTGSLTMEEETKITWDGKTITLEGESIPINWDPDEQKITLLQDRQELVFTVMTAAERIEAGFGVEGTPGTLSQWYDDSKSEAAKTVGFKVLGADWISISETAEGGDKGLCVWFEYTNNTDRYMAPYYVTAYAAQDGRELEEGMIYPNGGDLVTEETYRYVSIRPGVTGRSVHLFDADPEGGIIKYRVAVGYLDDSIIYEAELDPKKLPGRPAGKYKPKKIETIGWLEDVPEKGTFNEEFEISILNLEIKESDYGGSKYARVWFDFINNSAEEKSFFMTCYYRAVQDGITLNTGRATLDDPEPDKIYEMLAPGETAKICIEWQLRNDSPIAVELYDWWTEQTQLGKVFEVK